MDENKQLRESLRRKHREVQVLGSRWNFVLLVVLTLACQIALSFFDYRLASFTIYLWIGAMFVLQRTYFLTLPADLAILNYFENNEPELCQWLEDKAILDAAKIPGQ